MTIMITTKPWIYFFASIPEEDVMDFIDLSIARMTKMKFKNLIQVRLIMLQY